MRGVRHAIRRQLSDHLRHRAGLYFAAALAFVVGVTLGALAVGALDDTQRLELAHYVQFFLQSLGDPALQPDPAEVARRSLASQLRTGAFMYALGLSVVGAPLCLLVLLLRGFVSGFAVAFLVGYKGWVGVLMAVLAVLPQHLLAVPALAVLAVSALSFAGRIAARRKAPDPSWRALAAYSLTALACLLALAAAGLVEAYVSPAWLRVLASLGLGAPRLPVG